MKTRSSHTKLLSFLTLIFVLSCPLFLSLFVQFYKDYKGCFLCFEFICKSMLWSL